MKQLFRAFPILVALFMVAAISSPAQAQVGLEEGTQLTPKVYDACMKVWTSAVDTIATTASDTTGIFYIGGYSYVDPIIVYTIAGTITSVGIRQQCAPTTAGPWITMATDSITAAASGYITLTEESTYRMPFLRLIIAGSAFPINDSIFSVLILTAVKDP